MYDFDFSKLFSTNGGYIPVNDNRICLCKITVPLGITLNLIARVRYVIDPVTGKPKPQHYKPKAAKEIVKDTTQLIEDYFIEHFKTTNLAESGLLPERAIMASYFGLAMAQATINRKDWTNLTKMTEDSLMRVIGLNDLYVRYSLVNKFAYDPDTRFYSNIEGLCYTGNTSRGRNYGMTERAALENFDGICYYELWYTGYADRTDPGSKFVKIARSKKPSARNKNKKDNSGTTADEATPNSYNVLLTKKFSKSGTGAKSKRAKTEDITYRIIQGRSLFSDADAETEG
jgi:hypothetical protein